VIVQEAKRYDGSSITILEGLDAVRVRPGMYIGSTGPKGLHHLVWEILDNAIDEHLAGYCTEIKVTLHKDGSVTVEDNGRGIPVDIHPQAKIPTARVIFTTLHAGGKFDRSTYKISGGLHGVGASVVNALSEWLDVEIYREGKVHHDRYENGGKPVVELTQKGTLPEIGKADHTGTKIRFKPDRAIFETVEFSFETVRKRLQETAYLNKGLILWLFDERTAESVRFCEERGIEGLVKRLNADREATGEIISFSGVSNGIEIDIALQYTREFTEQIISYCNNIATVEGGTHVTGFKAGWTKLVNQYAKELRLAKEPFDGRDIRSGMVAVISIRHPDPQYEGQVKARLGSSDAKSAVEDCIIREGARFFDRHVDELKHIVEQAERALKVRKAEDRARINLQSKEIQLQTNGKLASCLTRDKSKRELFIVEGDSAGGTAKQGRDRNFQAILPIRGKILNIEKNSIDRALKNVEITTLFSALGCGFGDQFDLSKLEYDKIIIMTDADVDGSHIRTLLLTLFYRYAPELILKGHIYRAIPPLYRLELEKKKGLPPYVYAYSDAERDRLREKYGRHVVKDIQRYKGLGEMSSEQLWETTMNPKTRRLGLIQIEDAVEADVITTLLMGAKVEPRREFIIQEAPNANVDL
jgi:DNA gyrase subunit B